MTATCVICNILSVAFIFVVLGHVALPIVKCHWLKIIFHIDGTYYI